MPKPDSITRAPTSTGRSTIGTSALQGCECLRCERCVLALGFESGNQTTEHQALVLDDQLRPIKSTKWLDMCVNNDWQLALRDSAHDWLLGGFLRCTTLAQWHDRWWPTIENSDRAANTVVQYEGILRLHVLAHLGTRTMASLRHIDLEEWLAILRENGLGQSGTRTARTLLGMMLSSAVESEVIRSNPLAGVKLPRRGATRAKEALTVHQVEALAAEACEYRELVLLLAYCGLRPNEAFALRRRHRDDFGQLVVEEGLVEVRGRLVATDGKTHQARVVPLPRFVADELDRLLERRPADGEALIFVTPQGRPIGLRNFRRRLVAAAAAAGLPEWFTPYVLRHTCASLMAQKGNPGDDGRRNHGSRPRHVPQGLRPSLPGRPARGGGGAGRRAHHRDGDHPRCGGCPVAGSGESLSTRTALT